MSRLLRFADRTNTFSDRDGQDYQDKTEEAHLLIYPANPAHRKVTKPVTTEIRQT